MSNTEKEVTALVRVEGGEADEGLLDIYLSKHVDGPTPMSL